MPAELAESRRINGMGEAFKSGQTIAHYRIIHKIGQGGMGAVYKAEDTKLRRPVALKFLLRGKFSSIDKQRFLREAQAAAALHHPNICTIYEVDEADGEIFFAMAYLEGQTLASKITDGAIEFDQALELGIQLADALQEAHSHGIVHRDIKSNNIVLTPKNQAVILDFGLAQISGTSKLTQTGATLGTAAYMSPEHARGQEVDRRGDLWSLAVVIYELATGQLPFRAAQDLAMLYCIVNEPHVPACQSRPSLPPAFDDIITLALAKDPDDRYQLASELATDLRRLKNLVAIETMATGKIAPLPPPPAVTTRRTLLATGAALAVAAGGWGLWRWAEAGASSSRETDLAGGPIHPLQIAVMPLRFVGSAPDPGDEAFSGGLGEWMGDRLAALERANAPLLVMKPAEIREAGVTGVSEAQRLFGVGRALTGSVQREGGSWRVTLNLVDAASIRQVQSAELHIQDIDTASGVRQALAAAAAMIGVDPGASAPVDAAGHPEAGAAFLKGLGYLRQSSNAASLRSAISQFERQLKTDPRNALALSYLALARLRLSPSQPDPVEVNAALAEARQAVESDPILPEAHVALGEAFDRLDKHQEAISEFRRALEIDAFHEPGRKCLIEALLADERESEAETVLLGYRRQRPADTRSAQEIAAFYAGRGRFEDAEREYQAALALTPGNQTIPIRLAAMYRQMGRLDQAKSQVERSLAIRASAEGYAVLGGIEFQAARYQQAATAYEMSTDMRPSSHQYWGALADSYRHSPASEGQSRAAFGRAIDLVRRDLVEAAGNAGLRSSLALYLAKSGQPADSLRELAAIPPGAHSDPTVLIRSAVIHELAGDRTRASQELKAAIEAGASMVDVSAEPDLASVPR